METVMGNVESGCKIVHQTLNCSVCFVSLKYTCDYVRLCIMLVTLGCGVADEVWVMFPSSRHPAA